MTMSSEQAKKIGQGGGTVKTTGMSHQDKNRIDKAVTDGKQGK